MSETAARNALKELLEEFSTGVDDIKKRCNTNDEQLAVNKTQLEKHELLLKNVKEKADLVKDFDKRLIKVET